MKIHSVILLIRTALTFVQSAENKNVTYCESYNAEGCDKENKEDCYTREKCGSAGIDKHNHCFTLWEVNQNTGIANVQMKGCFVNNRDCYEKSHCVQKNKDSVNQLYFCCCNGKMCNQNLTYTHLLEDNKKVPLPTVEMAAFFSDPELQIIIPVVATFLFFSILIVTILAWHYRHNKFEDIDEVSKVEMGQSQKIQSTQPSTTINNQQQQQQQPSHQNQQILEDHSLSDISSTSAELIEKKASGRFGSIWKARRISDDETVAVKVFPLRERQSWKTELDVFRLNSMEHNDLLKYVGACRVGDGLESEFWLMTAYCEQGSLHDYLKENIVTWDQVYDITLSIARGLNHLHQAQGAPSQPNYKPSLAHRDFKSKNVLLNSNLRACIADFGLALTIKPDGRCGTQHGRVGTLRYMAPEVLEGAINFRRDAFLNIDMYACALVFWELVSRCQIDDDPVSEYQIPFEKEVGLKPSLEEMQDLVVYNRRRPEILESWKKHDGLSMLCTTIEECWDHDADARISASCVQGRLMALKEEPIVDDT